MSTPACVTFDDFFKQAQQLFLQYPMTTRYSVKYRPEDQKMVMRCTNDVVHLQYATEQQADLKKASLLTSIMIELMALEKTNDEEAVREVIKRNMEGDKTSVPAPASSAASKKKSNKKA